MLKKRPFAMYEFSPSLTKQSFAEEVDVNNILERMRVAQDYSGLVSERLAQYGDVSEYPDYQDSLNAVNSAREAFDALPAPVKERFANDPGRLLQFLQDGSNYDEAVKLGLVVPKAPVEPDVVKDKASSESKSKKRSDGDAD